MAIASPMARPVPRTMAVMIPDFAAGRTALKMVWILVAPRAREALRKCWGTARSAVSLILITVGRIIKASTKTAEIKLAPPVNW